MESASKRILLFFVVIVVLGLLLAGCTEEIEIVVENRCEPVSATLLGREVSFTLIAGYETIKVRLKPDEEYTHGLISNLNHKMDSFTPYNINKSATTGVITVGTSSANTATVTVVECVQTGNVYTFINK